jgi:hypothetical protein
MGQIHAHDRVARLEQGEEDGEVGLGTGVGLDVGMGRTEQFFDPIDGNLLGRPSAYLLVSTDPCAAITAGEVKFSLAINSR